MDDPRRCAERLKKSRDRSQAVQALMGFFLALLLKDFDVAAEPPSASISRLFPEVGQLKWTVVEVVIVPWGGHVVRSIVRRFQWSTVSVMSDEYVCCVF